LFTGIVKTVGTIEARTPKAAGATLTLKARGLAGGLALGDSVAVNGVCLTVEEQREDHFGVTAVGETLSRTTLGRLRPGARVNLEPAATPDTALGGHIVQGHVDGVGRVKSFARVGADRLLTVEVPADVHSYLVPKGSIAVDGVSLTIVERKPGNLITITIIPFTLAKTIADGYRPGVEVNVEVDIIGKYVKEYLNRVQETTK
jgi:riboflavin synthase